MGKSAAPPGKPARESEVVTTHMILPSDANPLNAAFGGKIRHPILDWAIPRYVTLAGTGDRGTFVLYVRRGSRLDVTGQQRAKRQA